MRRVFLMAAVLVLAISLFAQPVHAACYSDYLEETYERYLVECWAWRCFLPIPDNYLDHMKEEWDVYWWCDDGTNGTTHYVNNLCANSPECPDR